MTNGKRKVSWKLVMAAAGLACVMAGGLGDSAAFAGDDASNARGPRGRWRQDWRNRARQFRHTKRGRFLALVQSLDLTDQQRQTMLEKARTAAPIAEAAKSDARRIVAQAWAQAAKDKAVDRKALRTGVKEQIKAVRAGAWTRIEPLAKDVVATLTPEQRQKFQEAATKRGRTVDDAKLAKFMGRLISRPMAVPYLEARLGVSTPK